jgi:hypothetical protein
MHYEGVAKKCGKQEEAGNYECFSHVHVYCGIKKNVLKRVLLCQHVLFLHIQRPFNSANIP